MTNEETKGRLESFIDTFNICKEHDNALVAVSISKEDIQAFTQAIKALETVSCIKEKCAYCPHCENCDVDDETLEIKALEQQQPCEDWYDVPSNEMTLEQARKAVKDLRKKLAEYLKQQPCEDAVSRQAVEKMIKAEMPERGMWEIEGDIVKDTVCEVCVDLMQELSKLPSVTPKEKTAVWVPTDDEPHEDYECNKCGYVVSTFTANIEPHTEYKYCPNCGARMVSE